MNRITRLRPAQPSDLSAILELFAGTIEIICSADYTTDQRNAWQASVENSARWMAKINRDDFWVAETDTILSGFASLKNNNYIDLMYVHKDFARIGIASLLLKKMLDLATSTSSEKVFSDVSITAKPFFEKHGFTVIKENHLILRGVAIMNYRMVLIRDTDDKHVL